jgi:hypothetical protein
MVRDYFFFCTDRWWAAARQTVHVWQDPDCIVDVWRGISQVWRWLRRPRVLGMRYTTCEVQHVDVVVVVVVVVAIHGERSGQL